jgi:hypothetical protein
MAGREPDWENQFIEPELTVMSSGMVVSSLQDYMTANPPPTPPDGGSNATSGFSTDGNPLEQAVTSLASDLKSGDTTSAASEVSDMIAHTSKHSKAPARTAAALRTAVPARRMI